MGEVTEAERAARLAGKPFTVRAVAVAEDGRTRWKFLDTVEVPPGYGLLMRPTFEFRDDGSVALVPPGGVPPGEAFAAELQLVPPR